MKYGKQVDGRRLLWNLTLFVPCFFVISNKLKKYAGDVILFIDEVHTLIGSGIVGRGNKGSGLDIANLLKPALGRGELQVILLYELKNPCTCIKLYSQFHIDLKSWK